MNQPQYRLGRIMNMNITFGAMASMWFIVCSPQAIFNVFVKNHLNASSSELGIIVAIVQISGVFHLASIFIYARLSRIKPYWIVMNTLHRLFGLVLAGVALWAARGGSKTVGFQAILLTIAVSWILTNMSSSGWWSWIADLIPENIRGTFFLRRSASINVVNIVWFFSVTLILDAFSDRNIFYVYMVIFLVGGVAGVLDIVFHIFIPEPVREKPRESIGGFADFLEPLRSGNFLGFSLAIGLASFSINIIAPFIAPYITAPEAIGAENTWLGIMYVISQLTWVLVAPLWGVLMDRFGRKPVVVLGMLFTVSWTGYLFLTSRNYVFLLPVIALAGGLLAPAFWEGMNQMMLTLTPQKNRIAFVAWYMTIVGVVSSGGALIGGVLYDVLLPVKLVIAPGLVFGSFHFVLLLSLLLVGVSILVLLRVREGREKPVGFVVARITNPGIFRIFVNMGIIGNTPDSSRVARALRTIEGASGDIALEEVLARLDDPYPEVREEAARALGRIGSPEAVDALIERLQDPESTIRTHAARALGRIKDRRAIPLLVQGLGSPSEDLQEACAQALGEIGGDESAEELLKLFTGIKSERVVASGAVAATRLGMLEAAWEILPRMHRTINPVLRNQLAIALGNLLGPYGKFYRYITGNSTQKEARVEKLFTDAQRNVARLLRKISVTGLDRDGERKVSGEGSCREEKAQVLLQLKKVEELSVRREHGEALILLHRTARSLISLFLGGAVSEEDEYLDHTFLFDPRLGLWWWFLKESMKHAAESRNTETAEIDVILGMYFLSHYLYADEEDKESDT